MGACRPDVADEAVSLLRDHPLRLLLQNVCEPDDRVERRPQLVRHVGEELVLRTVGRQQAEVGLAQLRGPLLHPMLERVGEPFEVAVEIRVFEGDGRLRRDRGEQQLVLLAEHVLSVALDRDDADDTVARDHRHAEPRLGRQPVLDRLQPDRPLLLVAREAERPAVADDPVVEPFPHRDPLFGAPLAVRVLDLERELVGRFVDERDREE